MDSSNREFKKVDYRGSVRKYSADSNKAMDGAKQSDQGSRSGQLVSDDRRTNVTSKTKSPKDKLSALKTFRRAKGLCFKCGEKWIPTHKCLTSVSLHALEEVRQILGDCDSVANTVTEEEVEDSGDDLMAISLQAVNGIEGTKTIQFRAFVAGQEVFMLVDSGSSHSFAN